MLIRFRDNGWISQETINNSYGPALDAAAASADEISDLIKKGQDDAAKSKLNTLASTLRTIRDQLRQIEKGQHANSH